MKQTHSDAVRLIERSTCQKGVVMKRKQRIITIYLCIILASLSVSTVLSLLQRPNQESESIKCVLAVFVFNSGLDILNCPSIDKG